MFYSSDTSLTFNDVSLVPGYSEVLPSDVSIRCNIGGKITLKAPIMSAAMDTVTMADMAIAMAQTGGLGVIHKNLSIGDQAKEVSKVKKYEAWVIAEPITVGPEATIADAKNLQATHRVSGFPVVTEGGQLVGMLTARDIRFANSDSHKVREAMSQRVVSAKPDVNTKDCVDIMKHNRVEKLPLVDDRGVIQGLVTIKDILQGARFTEAARDNRGRLMVAAAVGSDVSLEERAHALVAAGVDALVVDSAHGHSKSVVQSVTSLRRWFKDILIIAGNVVTKDGARLLFRSGADAIKVGIGPGSICTTRIVAGVGIPQLSAICEVASAAKEDGFSLIADGGIQYSGDIVKAIAAGAHAVMIGSLLAGTRESPGETILYGGREFKAYRGMGSLSSMREGSKERYGQAQVVENAKLVPEGIEGRIPYRGRASEVVYQLMGGLRAGMGYVGAQNIEQLQKVARFVRLTAAGQRESHVHDVTITKESPNYFFQD